MLEPDAAVLVQAHLALAQTELHPALSTLRI